MKQIILFSLSLFLFLSPPVLAVDLGTDVVSNSIALSSAELLPSATRILNSLVTFLAILSVLVIIFGGARWFLAGDNEDSVLKAKKTLIGGVIGLTIILSSWGITYLLMSKILNSTGATGDGQVTEDNNNDPGNLPCTPDCNNKDCGDDSCGHLCGTCTTPQVCSDQGKCYTPFICGTTQVIVTSTDFAYDCATSTPSFDTCVYNTIKIGDKCWLKENLNLGKMISTPSAPSNNSLIEKYCYANNKNNCLSDGGLYQWDEALSYGAGDICPGGWHLPSDSEQHEAEQALTDSGFTCDANRNGIPAGSSCENASFKLIAAGYVIPGFGFSNNWSGYHFRGGMWSATAFDSNQAWYRYLGVGFPGTLRTYDPKSWSLSVRCVQD